jgi:hypothetical protein
VTPVALLGTHLLDFGLRLDLHLALPAHGESADPVCSSEKVVARVRTKWVHSVTSCGRVAARDALPVCLYRGGGRP